jgi:hypothetical protein
LQAPKILRLIFAIKPVDGFSSYWEENINGTLGGLRFLSFRKRSLRAFYFLLGKFYTLRFFFNYELPKIQGLAEGLLSADGLTVEMETGHFFD